MPTNHNEMPNDHESTKKTVDTAAKGAAEYFAPGVGGKAYDMAKKTPVIGKKLDRATDKVAKKADRIPGVQKATQGLDRSGALNAANQGINVMSGMNGNPQMGASQTTSTTQPTPQDITQSVSQTKTQSQQEGVENTKSTPLFNKPKKRSFLSSDNDSQPKKDSPEEVIGKFKKYKNYISIGCAGIGCLGILAVIIFIIVCFWYVGDLFKIDLDLNLSPIGKNIIGFVDNVANTFSGCWFQNADQCQETQEKKFFQQVESVHKKYQEKYGVKLDSALIVSTLTYRDIEAPIEDNDEYDIEDSVNLDFDASDYRKARKMINALADHMAPLHMEEKVTIDEEGNEKIEYEWVRRLDLEAYKTYLEEEFLPNRLKEDNETNLEAKVERAVEEIYMRVDFYRALLGLDNDQQITYAAQCNYNATRVNVVSCDNKVTLANLSLKDYVLGVVYGEVRFSNNTSDEFYKTMIIAAKTYGLSRGRYDASTKTITIKSCTDDQVWCDINSGCYRDEEISGSGRYTVYPMGVELPIANTNRTLWANPLSKNDREKLSSIYDEVANYLYLDESYDSQITNLSYTNEIPYGSNTQRAWMDLADAGNDFKTIFELTSTDTRFAEIVREKYANKQLYDLSEHCISTGYSGNGNYQLDVSSNGSINVDNPIDFFSQYALGYKTIVKFGATSKNAFGNTINRTDDYYIYKYSCGPTSLSMIISAIGNISYLDGYYSNVSLSGGNNDEKLYVIAKVHRYLADHGMQAYDGGGRGYVATDANQLNEKVYAPLGIQFIAKHSIGNINSQLIYNYLAAGNLVLYNIQGAQCSREPWQDCGGFGNTNGGHFGVIYGYDATTDEFLVYDPVKTTYAPIRAKSKYVSKLNSIAAYGGI